MTTTSNLIVGITGPARSGKNEAETILQKYYGFRPDSFAAPIRELVMRLLGLKTLAELDAVKEIPQDLFGGKTPRYVMQTLGTEWGREMISPTLWVDSLFYRNKNEVRLVISDVRFENEARAIKERGGYIIKVDRPDVRISESSHASEAGIDEDLIDFFILNDEGLPEYHKDVSKVTQNILERHYDNTN